jgi:peptide/nickel transport system substrate-binding protein
MGMPCGSLWTEETVDRLIARDRLNRRRFLHLLGAATGAAMLGRSPSAATALAQDAPTPGGTLRVVLPMEPDSLDPHRTPSRYMWMVGLAVYDPLVISDNEANIYPNLAKSWEISPDQLTYTFTLRDDVTFHDGTPFNAEAVKYNYDRVVDPKTGSLLSNDDIGPYDSTTVVDDHTVQVKMKGVYGPLLRMLSLMEFAIISPTAAEAAGLDNYGRSPVGTGPFKFVEWIPQQSMTFERNTDYQWGSPDIYRTSGPAFLDGVQYQFITEPQTRLAALEAGEVDSILNVPELDVERLQSGGEFSVEKFPAMGHPTAFVLNTMKPPTDDINVRRAINKALDRDAINMSLFSGEVEPAFGPISPATFSYWPDVETINAYDPAEADRLLQESGWAKEGEFYSKDGQALTIELYTFGTTGEIGEAVQGQLKKNGIASNVNNLDWSEQKDIAFRGLHNGCLVTFGSPDPRIMKLLYHSENMRENGWAWSHFMEANPDEQAALDAALDAGEMTTDPAERQQHYTEAQRIIVENALELSVKNDFQIVGLAPTVQGWIMDDANYHPRVYNVSLAQE